jgi:hypothetical protein
MILLLKRLNNALLEVGPEKKLELDEMPRARSSSARLDAHNEPESSLFLRLVKRASQLGSARLGAARELARGSSQQQLVT